MRLDERGDGVDNRPAHLDVGEVLQSEEIADLAELVGYHDLLIVAGQVVGEIIEYPHSADVDERGQAGE